MGQRKINHPAIARIRKDSRLREIWTVYKGRVVNGHDHGARRNGIVCGFNDNGYILLKLIPHSLYDYNGWSHNAGSHAHIDKEITGEITREDQFWYVLPGTIQLTE